MPAFVYENTTDTITHRGVTLKFTQKGGNSHGIGTKVTLKFGDNEVRYGENFVSRGFQSSVPSGLHFGVGNVKKIDSVSVTWPNGKTSIFTDLQTNKIHSLINPEKSENSAAISKPKLKKSLLKEISPLFNFEHKENAYVDFNNERLLTQMYSNEGPAFATSDINQDGKYDFFIGGAKNQTATLFMSSTNGYEVNTSPFEYEIASEDVAAVFFDADNDGDEDLYVCHGGKAFSPYSAALHDAFYINKNGTLVKKIQPNLPIPISSSVARPSDYDNDGDLDLFIGERYKTNLYGLPTSGYILENDGLGNFKSIEKSNLKDIGMITDAAWHDFNNDGWQDLIVLGEWMPLKIYINQKGTLVDQSTSFNLTGTSGLWTALELVDIDGDGDQDIIAGNIGRNNFFEPEMRMYIADFDGNGFKEQITCKKKDGKYYPIVDKDELISQIPSLKKKLLYYKDYAKADMNTIFSEETLKKTLIVDLKILESNVFINHENRFTPYKLPNEIQYAPSYAITTTDLNQDGYMDMFFGGNQHLVKPQFGQYDASMGWAIFGPYSKKNEEMEVTSLKIKGQIRDLKWINQNNKKILIATLNDEKTGFYVYEE